MRPPVGGAIKCPTWQSVDEPTQLLLGNVGPAEVQEDRLTADDAAEHQRRDGGAAVQVYLRPEPLIATPGGHNQKSNQSNVDSADKSEVKLEAMVSSICDYPHQGAVLISSLTTVKKSLSSKFLSFFS